MLFVQFRVVGIGGPRLRDANRRSANVSAASFVRYRRAICRFVLALLCKFSPRERPFRVDGRFFNVPRNRVTGRALVVFVGVVVGSDFLPTLLLDRQLLRAYRCFLRGKVVRGRFLTVRRHLCVYNDRRLSHLRSCAVHAHVRHVRPWLFIRCLADGGRRLRVQVILPWEEASFRASNDQSPRTRIRWGRVKRLRFRRFPGLVLDRDHSSSFHVQGFISRCLFHSFWFRFSVLCGSSFGSVVLRGVRYFFAFCVRQTNEIGRAIGPPSTTNYTLVQRPHLPTGSS